MLKSTTIPQIADATSPDFCFQKIFLPSVTKVQSRKQQHSNDRDKHLVFLLSAKLLILLLVHQLLKLLRIADVNLIFTQSNNWLKT
jgi:hypothetical protein